MVDRALLADRVAAVRDATARIRTVLPASVEAFRADRTAREVVVLNLLVAIQTCLDLASHWLADEGWDVPATYGDVFLALADHDVLPRDLARRLAAASGMRNLIAHQYAILDWQRVHAIAQSELGHLEVFCAALATKAG